MVQPRKQQLKNFSSFSTSPLDMDDSPHKHSGQRGLPPIYGPLVCTVPTVKKRLTLFVKLNHGDIIYDAYTVWFVTRALSSERPYKAAGCMELSFTAVAHAHISLNSVDTGWRRFVVNRQTCKNSNWHEVQNTMTHTSAAGWETYCCPGLHYMAQSIHHRKQPFPKPKLSLLPFSI